MEQYRNLHSARPLTIWRRAERESIVDAAVQELRREAELHIARQRQHNRERAFERRLACGNALAWIEKIEREDPEARGKALGIAGK